MVVRVRKIAEDRAAMAAASAVASAQAARLAAELAHERSKEHPLQGSTRVMSADQLAVAAGTGAALREAAASAEREMHTAQASALEASLKVAQARAEREAAERFVERRRAAAELEAERKNQRQLDESGLATWKSA